MLIRRWLLLLILVGAVVAEDPTPLPEAIARLVEAQAQVQSACAVAHLAIPPGLDDVLVVRRTIAADWQRRLTGGGVRLDDPGLTRFTGELQALASGLQALANLAQQLGDAPRRFPHCVAEPAFARYGALVGETFAQGMQALLAGRLRDQIAPAAWYARQARHTALLTLIEAGHVAEERYGRLPRDDRWLVEYREHLLLTRTTLERTLDLTDREEGDHHQRVHEAYTRLLDTRIAQLDLLAECGLPGDAPEVQVYRRLGEQQVAALGRQVALAQVADPGDDQGHWQRLEAERWRLTRIDRLVGQASRWLELSGQRKGVLDEFAEPLAEAPVVLAAELRALVDATGAAYRMAQAAFVTAVDGDDPLAALTAVQAGERANHQLDRRLMHVHDDVAVAAREELWRTYGKDPVIAEKLHEWETRRAGHLAKRRAADEAAEAAQAATHAEERATLAREVAEERSGRADQAVYDDDLGDLIQALDDMVELRAGAQPGQ